MRTAWQGAVIAAGMAVAAAAPPGPSEDQLAESVRLGSLAALAPVCGLRDERWAADLRRSAIQSATGSKGHADGDLAAAPGSNLVIGALSFAEAEALEAFAEAAPDATCGPLGRDPNLARADGIVRDFRAQAGPATPGS